MPTSPSQKSWTASPIVAHIAPLMLFMLLTELARWFKIENSALPWYQRAPEHWVYPVQCVLVGTMLWMFRKHYVFGPWRGLGLAVLFAVFGIVMWIVPSWMMPMLEPTWWQDCLGFRVRQDGFDPDIFIANPLAWWTTVLLRFARMILIVPLVEELCWRGFLMRYVQAGEKPFTSVPFGTHTWRAFWIVTLAVTFIHNQSDWFAAFLWGSLTYFLAVSRKSLGACILMHTVGNLLLGLYVIKTKLWGFW